MSQSENMNIEKGDTLQRFRELAQAFPEIAACFEDPDRPGMTGQVIRDLNELVRSKIARGGWSALVDVLQLLFAPDDDGTIILKTTATKPAERVDRSVLVITGGGMFHPSDMTGRQIRAEIEFV